MDIFKAILVATSISSLLLQPTRSSSSSKLCALTTDPQACEKFFPDGDMSDVTMIAELTPLDFKHLTNIAQPEVVQICKPAEYPSACVFTYYFAAKGKMDKTLMSPMSVLDMELKLLKKLLTSLEFDISTHPELEDFVLCGVKFDHALKELTVAEEAMKTGDMRIVKTCLQYALVFNGHCEVSIRTLKKINPGLDGLGAMNHFGRCISIMARNCMSLANAIEKKPL